MHAGQMCKIRVGRAIPWDQDGGRAVLAGQNVTVSFATGLFAMILTNCDATYCEANDPHAPSIG